ncbi:protein PFC0760c-like [Helianthus annuus]|nr:protein PFC0760c-like [Helianthus annuus]
MRKVLENLIGKPVEQRFEEIKLEEVRARRKAEIEEEMKNKGKGAQVEGVSEVTKRAIIPSIVSESPIQNSCPISSVSGVFDDDVEIDDVVDDDVEDNDEEDDEEEDDDEVKKDDADDVFSASSHDDDDDDGNDDDDQGTSGIKVTEASNEENVDDYLHDDANEEPENAESEGEHVDESEKLILRLEPDVEEGEFRHSYTLTEIIKLTHIDENEFKFDFEEELNEFDINQQHEYEYKYVEDADNYDRVEVEDCSDEEQSVNVDTSNFPALAEFFSQANEDKLRRKVAESVKNKSFHEMSKEEQREERKKWFRKDTERKFK